MARETNEEAPNEFEAMHVAAEESRLNPEPPALSTIDPAIPEKTLSEAYTHQIELNLAAHRRMRWLAFVSIGVLAAIYLLYLLEMLTGLFIRNGLVALFGAMTEAMGWHALALIGFMAVVFAIIPLSLAMALLKMISDKEDSSYELKAPSAEAGKLIYDLIKGVANRK